MCHSTANILAFKQLSTWEQFNEILWWVAAGRRESSTFKFEWESTEDNNQLLLLNEWIFLVKIGTYRYQVLVSALE